METKFFPNTSKKDEIPIIRCAIKNQQDQLLSTSRIKAPS